MTASAPYIKKKVLFAHKHSKNRPKFHSKKKAKILNLTTKSAKEADNFIHKKNQQRAPSFPISDIPLTSSLPQVILWFPFFLKPSLNIKICYL